MSAILAGWARLRELHPYHDRHGGQVLPDAEAERLGVQPRPEHREMIHDAALMQEYLTAEEQDELERQLQQR